MLNNLIRIAEQRNFFNLIKHNEQITKFNLNNSGVCMKHNIIAEWLRSILYRSKETFRFLVNIDTGNVSFQKLDILEIAEKKKQNTPMGLVEISKNNSFGDCKSEEYFHPCETTQLKLCVAAQQSEVMPLFLAWQRYRKIWWSSITTSAGLFHLSDITYKENGAEVSVMAKFPWGHQPVENISVHEQLRQDGDTGELVKRSRLESVLTVECALLTLLADGYANRTTEDYLRLHRTMAPYKMSFAVESTEAETKRSLQELADHLNCRLNDNGISTWFPVDFSASLDHQVQEKYRLGVPYTVVLTADALHTGVLHLLHSSTTLQEQIHVADFDEYALRLLKSCFTS